jgi:hypothetical protein
MTWGDLGGLIGGLSALAGVVVAIRAIGGAQKSQREATAYETYRQYLNMAFENPDLASGQVVAGDKMFAAYTWFVSNLLNGCEQILDVLGDDPLWEKTLRSQLNYHRAYLCDDPNFAETEIGCYAPKLQRLVKSMCERGS